jgi:DMSO/TMAO reductase YedYZ molybdopterin-dependent catalytic subunit
MPRWPKTQLDETGAITLEELALATRNHGMPLEALRWPVTPIGLHYLLIHYDIPEIDPDAWRLEVGGLVDRPLALSLDDLMEEPAVTVVTTMECAGTGRGRFQPRPLSQPWLHEAVGTAEWTGVPLGRVLDRAGLRSEASEILLEGLDRGLEAGEDQTYARSLAVGDAVDGDAVLAYEMNGAPLPPQHGFPLRFVNPGWYGMGNVKWLARVTAIAEPFAGYQNDWAYRRRSADDEHGDPITRIEPRSLMVPPGRPEFFTRVRYLEPEPCELTGRAWSGWGPIDAVWVSTDGGGTWDAAEVEPPALGPWAWQGWRYRWASPPPGRHVLACRARDASGRTQPLDPPWNLGGYANNAPHTVVVEVAEA